MASYADVWALHRAFTEGHRDRAWGELQAQVAERLVVVDHRPTGWGEIRSSHEFIDVAKKAVENAPDDRLETQRVLGLTDRGWAVVHAPRGTNRDGRPAEQPFVGLGIVEGGRLARYELYPSEDVSSALARFDELASATYT